MAVLSGVSTDGDAPRRLGTLGHAANRASSQPRERLSPQRVHRSPRPRRLPSQLRSLRTTTPDEVKLRLSRGEGAEAHQARARAEPGAVEAGVRAERRAAVRQSEPRLRRCVFVFVFVSVLKSVYVFTDDAPANAAPRGGRFRCEHEPGRRPVRVAHGDVAAGTHPA